LQVSADERSSNATTGTSLLLTAAVTQSQTQTQSRWQWAVTRALALALAMTMLMRSVTDIRGIAPAMVEPLGTSDEDETEHRQWNR